MKKCRNCGFELEEMMNFCPRCHAKYSATASPLSPNTKTADDCAERSRRDFIFKSGWWGPTGLAWWYIGRKRIAAAVALASALSLVLAICLTCSLLYRHCKLSAEWSSAISHWQSVAEHNIQVYEREMRSGRTQCEYKLKKTKEFLAELDDKNKDYYRVPDAIEYDITLRGVQSFYYNGRCNVPNPEYHTLTRSLRMAGEVQLGWGIFFGVWLLQFIAAFYVKTDAEGRLLR